MSMLRFLPGILIVQAATAALIVAATGASSERVWLPLAVLGVVVAGFAALWFSAISEHQRKDALAAAARDFAREREALAVKYARERESLATNHARERESLRVAAESEKLAALESTHQRIVKETGRAEARANFKLGVGLLGLLSVGGLMLAIEFMTMGLLIFTTTGGALGGYVARARQEKLAARKRAAQGGLELDSPPLKAIRGERLDSDAAGKEGRKRRG
jgi:fatty acid desaturase